MDIPAGKSSEIKEWLDAKGCEVANYAILDNVPDMFPEQQSYFVQTDPRVGVTKDDAERIIEILTY